MQITEKPIDRLAHLRTLPRLRTRVESEWIYVIGCHDLVKIGIAGNVRARLAELQVGNPYDLVLIGRWKALNAMKEEEAIHAYFEAYRVRGEWFKLPKSLMDTITRKLNGYDLAQSLTPPTRLDEVRADLYRLNPYASPTENM